MHKRQKCLFGKIVNGEMVLNDTGKIAFDEWVKLSERFPNFDLDVFQIMPNHMHGIIVLNDVVVGATLAVAPNTTERNDNGARFTRARTGDIVGAYKSLVANECLKIYKTKNEIMGKLWQRNYYEHIIRNEQSYKTISNYIIENPAKWNDDNFFVG